MYVYRIKKLNIGDTVLFSSVPVVKRGYIPERLRVVLKTAATMAVSVAELWKRSRSTT